MTKSLLLEATETRSLTILKGRSPELWCQQGHLPSGGSREVPSYFLAPDGSRQPWACGCIAPSLPPLSRGPSSLPMSLLCVSRLVIGFSAHPGNPEPSRTIQNHLGTLNLITSTNIFFFFQIKSHPEAPGGTFGCDKGGHCRH